MRWNRTETDTDPKNKRPVVDSWEIKKPTDQDPDLSHLETTQDTDGTILDSCRYSQKEYEADPTDGIARVSIP